MKTSARLVILNYTRYGENSIVVHTLAREYGRRSFLVRIGKKTGMSLFLPLNIVEATVVTNPKSDLWTAHGFSALYPLGGIRDNIYKNSMTMFLSEVLFRVVGEGGGEDGMYDWCVKEILTLDALESDWSNFHIRFLLDLAIALGFSPSAEDMLPFAGSRTRELKALMEASFADSMLIPLSGEMRSALCEDILRYLEFHTESPVNIRSLAVLREILH